MLARDPLFLEAMNAMEADIHNRWRENRLEAMDVLESHATKAAQLCVSAIDGVVESFGLTEDGETKKEFDIVPLKQRLDSAWDVLNRTGNKAAEKKVVAHTTLQEMIIAAYQQRHGGNGGGDGKDASANGTNALAPSIISQNAEDHDILDIDAEEDEDDDEYSAFEAVRSQSEAVG